MIYFFSSLPDLNTGLKLDYPLRKAAHMGEYGVLWALTRRALAGTFAWGELRAGLAAALGAALYAAGDEWHQAFVPGRQGTPWDVLIDAIGTGLAWALRAARAR